MKLRSTLAGTAVLASLLGAGAVLVGPLTKPAYAQTSISIGVFYDGLADHGDWVQYDNRYVFVPAGIDADWRPYTVGHWVYADRYGWTWASNEPFGWATFHYGRWGFAEDVGWYWVPGTVWAPAWVSWKRTSDHVVWAPLPVYDGYDYNDSEIRIDVNAGSIPDDYWVAVPSRQFLEINLNVVIIDDRDRRRTIVREAEPLGTVVIENNVVINNVVNVNYIEEQTGRDVKVVEVRETKDPKEGRATDDEVVAVTEPIRAEKDAKPEKISDIKEVESRQKDRKSSDADDQPLGNAVVDEADKPDAAGDQDDSAGAGDNEPGSTLPRKKNQAGDQPATDDTSAATGDDASDELQQGDNDQQPQKKRQKKAGQQQPDTQGVIDEDDNVQDGQASEEQTGQKVKRKKRKAEQSETQGVVDEDDKVNEGQASEEQTGQKVKRKKRKAEQSETQGVVDDDDNVQQGQPADEQTGQKPKRKKRQAEQPDAQGVIDEQDRVQQGQSNDQQKPKRKQPKVEQSDTQGAVQQPQGQDAPGPAVEEIQP